MSAEIFRLELVHGGGNFFKRHSNQHKERGQHIQQICESSGDLWNEKDTAIHGLHTTHKSIVYSDLMAVVWRHFEEWIQSNISQDYTAILVAWNGEKCNLLWLWKLTQAPQSPFFIPVKIKYFIDPYQFIGNYGSFSLNKKKLKLDIYELGVIWKYINDGDNLNRAHNIMVDTKAQTDIIINKIFISFINSSSPVQLISGIFSKNLQNKWRKDMDTIRKVHAPWKEPKRYVNIKWQPGPADQYKGPSGCHWRFH